MNSRFVSPLLLGLLAPLALLASCDSGADVSAEPGPGTPPGLELNADFNLRRDLRFGNGQLGDMLLEDMNGDQILDLVFSDFSARKVLISYGVGAGEFNPMPVELDVPANPLNLAVGDYDGNGRLDVAVAGSVPTDAAQPTTEAPLVAVLLQTAEGVWDGDMIAPLELSQNPFDVITAVMKPGGADDLIVTVPDARATLWITLVGLELTTVKSYSSAQGEQQGGKPLTVAAYDLDRDDRLDLIVGEFQTAGEPTGRVISFGNLPELSETGFPGIEKDDPFVVLGNGFADPIVRSTSDLNGDERDELAVAEFAGTAVSVFQPAGAQTPEAEFAGTFERVDFGAGITALLVDDLDRDGTADLAVTLYRSNAIAVAYGGDGLLADAEQFVYSVGRIPRALAAGDLDDDQETDLVCLNVEDLSCIFGRGDRELRAAVGYPLAGRPETLLCADFDADGNSDVAVIDGFQTQIEFLAGDGDGLTSVGTVLLDQASEQTPGYLIAEDFDGDGDLDLLTSFYDGNAVGLLRNSGTLPLDAPVLEELVAVGERPIGLGAARIDADDTLDVVVANFGSQTLQLLRGNGDGTFEATQAFDVPAAPIAVALEDYDRDGNIDIAVSTGAKQPTDPDAFVLVYRGNGDGSFSAEPVSSSALAARAPMLIAEDFDDDGLPDLVASQPADVSMSIYYIGNNGEFDFSARSILVGSNPGALQVADVNSDDEPDILVPLGVGELRVLLGDFDGPSEGFAGPFPTDDRFLSVPFLTSSVALCNVTGDERADLVLVSPENAFVWVAENLGLAPGQ